MIIIKIVSQNTLCYGNFKYFSNLRLRMFLCSSSSVVGLWLKRLKGENYVHIFSYKEQEIIYTLH